MHRDTSADAADRDDPHPRTDTRRPAGPAASGGQRSEGGSNYGDWHGHRDARPGVQAPAGPQRERSDGTEGPDPYAEAGDRWTPEFSHGAEARVPGRYQGGALDDQGHADQGAGGEPGQNRRYGDSLQDDPHPGYSGDAWADRDWQQDAPGAAGQPQGPRAHDEAATPPSPPPRSPQQQQGGAGQTSVGAGPGERLQVSGIAAEPGAQNAAPPPQALPHGPMGPQEDAVAPQQATPAPGRLSGGHNASVPGQGRDNGRGLGG